MPSFKRIVAFFVPSTLYARFFWLQLLLLVLITMTFLVLFAMNQTRSAMENIADVWAPAISDVLLRPPPAGNEKVTVSQQVDLLHGVPPADAYSPNWTHLRWRALQEALRAHDVPVHDLVISGRTGAAVVWFYIGQIDAPRWIGVRSNLEGTDFPARWAIAMALSLMFVGLAAWWLSHRITAPLRQLERAVQAFSAGKQFVTAARNTPAEFRTLTHAFEQMTREREDLDAQRALMLAGISHDIRSPLARIRMAAELLPAEGEMVVLRERIVRNIGIADTLIASFSDYVRAESEPMDRQVDIVELVTALARATGVEYETALTKGPVMVKGSEHLLQRALGNLIDNAKQHGKPPIALSVNLGRSGTNEVRVTVSDQGGGIAPRDHERLVRPFERGDAARATPGSGLGLAIAMRVAQRHGGRLEITTHLGGGAVCTLTLPQAGC